MSASELDPTETWTHARDSINLVTGAILGAYLGLAISRTGVTGGSNLDLFALITFTAFSVTSLVGVGNNWFVENRRLAFVYLIFLPLNVWLSIYAAGKLAIDVQILGTIYLAWFWLILMQISAFAAAKALQKRTK